jgi:hypothetical protein
MRIKCCPYDDLIREMAASIAALHLSMITWEDDLLIAYLS